MRLHIKKYNPFIITITSLESNTLVSETVAFLLLLASQLQFNVNTFVHCHGNPKHWMQVFRLLGAFNFEITYN